MAAREAEAVNGVPDENLTNKAAREKAKLRIAKVRAKILSKKIKIEKEKVRHNQKKLKSPTSKQTSSLHHYHTTYEQA